MENKYIVGDLVFDKWQNNKVVHISATSKYGYCFEGTNEDVSGALYKDDIAPISLTTEILEKNEWERNGNSCSIIRNGIAIAIVIEDKVCSVFVNNTLIIEVKYVHELQHLLLGLGINSDMEV